jgi:hypothetical protein
MSEKDILSNFIAAFDKLATKPMYDPTSKDFEEERWNNHPNYSSPEDDYFDPKERRYEGLINFEPGSNYSYLTNPLPEHQEDERVEFARHLLIIQKHYQPRLLEISERLADLQTLQSKFIHSAKISLLNIAHKLEILYSADSRNSPQDVVDKVRLATRDAAYIRHAFNAFIEADRLYGKEQDLEGQYTRIADQLVIIGKNMLKALNAATSKSYKKRRGNNSWEF